MADSGLEAASEARYKAGDVCRMADVQPYVLRYWESEFPVLAPDRGASGRCLYSPRDFRLSERIKKLLYDEGYTIAGAKKRLEGELKGVTAVTAVASPEPPQPQPEASRSRGRVAVDVEPVAVAPPPLPVPGESRATVEHLELAGGGDAGGAAPLAPGPPPPPACGSRARFLEKDPELLLDARLVELIESRPGDHVGAAPVARHLEQRADDRAPRLARAERAHIRNSGEWHLGGLSSTPLLFHRGAATLLVG